VRSRRNILRFVGAGLITTIAGCSEPDILDSQKKLDLAYVSLLNLSDQRWKGNIQITDNKSDEQITKDFTLSDSPRGEPDNQEQLEVSKFKSRSYYDFSINTERGTTLTISSKRMSDFSPPPEGGQCIGAVFAFRSDGSIGAFAEYKCTDKATQS